MPPFAPSPVGDASRLRLARLALDVVSGISDVAGTDPGPHGSCVTADPPAGLLQGVSVIAQADGRYEVDLCLIARLPLLSIGAENRRRLRVRAEREGLARELGTVNVQFAGALSAGETLEEPAVAHPAPTGELPNPETPEAQGLEQQGPAASPAPAGAPSSPPAPSESGEASGQPFREPRP